MTIIERKKYNAEYRLKNKEKIAGQILDYQKKNRAKLNQKENEIRQANKSKLIHLLGGRCQKCQYSKSEKALDFHHREQSKKKFQISDRLSVRSPKTWKEVEEEAKKCDLLCANCHREHTHIY